MRLTRLAAVALLSLNALAGGVEAGELRTWSDSTGNHKIDAEFLEVLDGNVRLKRADGKTLSLPLAKLSKPDQAYLRNLLKRQQAGDPNDPFEAGLESSPLPRAGDGPRGRAPRGEGPFQVDDRVEILSGASWAPATVTHVEAGGSFIDVRVDGQEDEQKVILNDAFIRPLRKGGDADKRAGALAASQRLTDDAKTVEPKLSNVRRIVVGDKKGRFVADPEPAASDSRYRPVVLQPAAGPLEKVLALDLAALPAGKVLAAFGNQTGMDDLISRIELCDPRGGRVQAMTAPPKLKRAAISPSGKRLATVSEAETFKDGPLRVWDVGATALSPVIGWRAVGERPGRSELKWIGWIDDAHLVTLDDSTLTMWKVAGAEAVYRVPCERAESATFSPGRKQLALVADEGVTILSTRDGDVLARLPLSIGGFDRQAAFSPNGKYLAVTGSEQLETLDIASEKSIDTVFAAAAGPFTRPAWLGNEHVLVGGADLVHIPSRMVVWTYNHQAAAVDGSGGRIWYLFGDMPSGERTLVPFALPYDKVKPAGDAELAVAPGAEVALTLELVVELADGAGRQESAQALLKKSLEDAGFRVVDESPVRLVARMSPGETKEMAYRTFGRGFGDVDKVSVTERNYDLELSVDGQVVWKRRRTQTAPFHLRTSKDESTDQAVAREMAPKLSYFEGRIPSRILSPELAEERGSTLTASGIQ